MTPAQRWSLGISLALLAVAFAWFSTRSISCTWAPFGGSRSTAARAKPLDVNAATFDQLDALPYLTPQMAEGLIAGRPWASIDDLVDVRGIGEVTLEKIRPYLYVE